jgi:hypothetical protein
MLSVLLTDYAGSAKDLNFLHKAEWLKDSAVIQYIYEQKGRWKIALIFACIQNPMQLICRYMNDDYSTEQKAVTYAFFYSRTTQKDSNNKSTLNYHDYHICFN